MFDTGLNTSIIFINNYRVAAIYLFLIISYEDNNVCFI